ncbi:hypothetical protein [Natrononativus amylolyticus]|uniref:hypothetical protein n=1 Tax=Natrononativus amylolyticus TaxID=2963434 RepID=UPI0020CFD3FF|nr:hypothetical protein [Natrononativus amylolyticus]
MPPNTGAADTLERGTPDSRTPTSDRTRDRDRPADEPKRCEPTAASVAIEYRGGRRDEPSREELLEYKNQQLRQVTETYEQIIAEKDEAYRELERTVEADRSSVRQRLGRLLSGWLTR